MAVADLFRRLLGLLPPARPPASTASKRRGSPPARDDRARRIADEGAAGIAALGLDPQDFDLTHPPDPQTIRRFDLPEPPQPVVEEPPLPSPVSLVYGPPPGLYAEAPPAPVYGPPPGPRRWRRR